MTEEDVEAVARLAKEMNGDLVLDENGKVIGVAVEPYIGDGPKLAKKPRPVLKAPDAPA